MALYKGFIGHLSSHCIRLCPCNAMTNILLLHVQAQHSADLATAISNHEVTDSKHRHSFKMSRDPIRFRWPFRMIFDQWKMFLDIFMRTILVCSEHYICWFTGISGLVVYLPLSRVSSNERRLYMLHFASLWHVINRVKQMPEENDRHFACGISKGIFVKSHFD